MNNFPPGVTGAEYHIAGPDDVQEIQMTCHDGTCDDGTKCAYDGTVEAELIDGVWSYECPECSQLYTAETHELFD
jgi:hypothetical protein